MTGKVIFTMKMLPATSRFTKGIPIPDHGYARLERRTLAAGRDAHGWRIARLPIGIGGDRHIAIFFIRRHRKKKINEEMEINER